jgi:hypothetical protein
VPPWRRPPAVRTHPSSARARAPPLPPAVTGRAPLGGRGACGAPSGGRAGAARKRMAARARSGPGLWTCRPGWARLQAGGRG